MINGDLLRDTNVRHVANRVGRFSVLEYDRDVSVNPLSAQVEYFCSKMNYKKRQLVATMDPKTGVVLQAGAMQMMVGDIQMNSNIKGVGDFAKKLIGSKVTGESASKPLYKGTGTVLCEPTYKDLIIENLADWGGAMTTEGQPPWWVGRASNPVGGATRRWVGSTPMPFRHFPST